MREPVSVSDRSGSDVWPRMALLAWGAVVLLSCGRAALYHHSRHRGVYEVYHRAGSHWVAGQGLYTPGFHAESFAYSPSMAAVLVPFSLLPVAVGSALWRFCLCAVYLLALARWSAVAWPRPPDQATRAKLFLLVLPVTGPTLVNGQAGALVVALLLLALTEVVLGRWNRAARFAVLPGFVKVYPWALGMLLASVFPKRLAMRLVLALTGCLLLTLILQRPAYVLREQLDWLRLLGTADQSTWYRGDFNCDLQMLLARYAQPLPLLGYRILQLVLAAGTAGLCISCRAARWDRPRLLMVVLGLGTCWMAVVGPAVESFTYILIGPTLAWLLLDTELCPGRLHRATLWLSWAFFTTATLAFWTPFGSAFRKLGPHPAAGLLLTVGLVTGILVRLRAGKRVMRGVLLPEPVMAGREPSRPRAESTPGAAA